jgi:hypothetical protein
MSNPPTSSFFASLSPEEITSLFEVYLDLTQRAKDFLAELIKQSRVWYDEFNTVYEPMEEDEKYLLMEAVGESYDIVALYFMWEENMIDGEELVAILHREIARLRELLVFAPHTGETA